MLAHSDESVRANLRCRSCRAAAASWDSQVRVLSSRLCRKCRKQRTDIREFKAASNASGSMLARTAFSLRPDVIFLDGCEQREPAKPRCNRAGRRDRPSYWVPDEIPCLPNLPCRVRVRFAQALHDLARIARNQLRNHFIVQPREERAIAGEIPAIQQRNRELGIGGIEVAAFGESARGGAELQSQIPKILRKFADCVFEHCLPCRFRHAETARQYRRNGKSQRRPKAAQRYTREIRGAVGFRRERIASKDARRWIR